LATQEYGGLTWSDWSRERTYPLLILSDTLDLTKDETKIARMFDFYDGDEDNKLDLDEWDEIFLNRLLWVTYEKAICEVIDAQVPVDESQFSDKGDDLATIAQLTMVILLLTVDETPKKYKEQLRNVIRKKSDITKYDFLEFLKALRAGHYLEQMSKEIRQTTFKVLNETGGFVTMSETKGTKVIDTTVQVLTDPSGPKLQVRLDISNCLIPRNYKLPAGDISINHAFEKAKLKK